MSEFFQNFKITLTNEWLQVFGSYKAAGLPWYSFTIFTIYFENEVATKHYWMEVTILGLGFRVAYDYSFEETEIYKETQDAIEKSDE